MAKGCHEKSLTMADACRDLTKNSGMRASMCIGAVLQRWCDVCRGCRAYCLVSFRCLRLRFMGVLGIVLLVNLGFQAIRVHCIQLHFCLSFNVWAFCCKVCQGVFWIYGYMLYGFEFR